MDVILQQHLGVRFRPERNSLVNQPAPQFYIIIYFSVEYYRVVADCKRLVCPLVKINNTQTGMKQLNIQTVIMERSMTLGVGPPVYHQSESLRNFGFVQRSFSDVARYAAQFSSLFLAHIFKQDIFSKRNGS